MLEKNPPNDTKGLLDTQNNKLKNSQWVKAPTKLELFTVRFMILLGLASMGFFLNSVLSLSVRGYAPLYWMLITTFVYICLKTLHEWYHYLCITVPETPVATKIYTVDIFTTFCAGEPYEMIEETLTAIQAITYPHKTYLCDEADDPYLRQFCVDNNVIHVTRKEKKNAKAGNINNALTKSSGELCVVLDPDHVPFPNFLDPIVSHFDNPEVGYVQIVQAYKNMGDGFIARGAAQQTYQFYGPMMMTMNRYGTVLAIGANCTFRRTALESIGGHAAGLAEDLHTSMQLHAKGWKSVYVPAILARGLVPSTLSAYYQQQLKWSRGVFDLLVIAYPKLFKHFTWRQKLHYGVIPLHYVSGIIFLINFLIPILSLFMGVSPMDINLAEFALVALPLMAAVILIRHFVQWWVMEDRERGFHMVGGLLMTGTWWIYILGLVYTILRKKVPYIPTPKDGIEKNNWPLSIPNFVVLGLSLAAITYGLYTDWNPYTIIMSVFAGTNCLIMSFNIVVSRQQQYRVMKAKYPLFKGYMNQIKKLRVNFWFFRRRIYAGVRSTALMISLLITCSIVYYANYGSKTSLAKLPVEKTSYLFGIFAPDDDQGLTSLQSVRQFNTHFDIVSHYIPWGDKRQCFLPLKKLDATYRMGTIPMITWEPWQNLFETQDNSPDQKVFVKITSGHYDRYIREFAGQVKSLNKPVYLRFAHETDNPQYPWSTVGNNTAEEFKDAWKYVHRFFAANGVYNVIWVWNPWQAEAVASYFPGKEYVDWIGVTNLNYSRSETEKDWHSMEELYRPFHKQAVFGLGIPVMLAEMGSLNSASGQNAWFKQAFQAAEEHFPEIKGFVLFNSGFDKNVPLNSYDQGGVLNWSMQTPDSVFGFLTGRESASKPVTELLAKYGPITDSIVRPGRTSSYKGTRGVNYTKGRDWDKSRKAFTMKDMLADLNEMKSIGINTIKWKGPGIYDRNILNAAEELDVNIHYSYGIPDDLDFVKDTTDLKVISNEIVRSVNNLKNNEKIVSWNIGNTVFYWLGRRYIMPELLYQQDAYLSWLQKLVQKIKQIDPNRDVTVDLAISQATPEMVERIQRMIPEIDSYGIVMDNAKTANRLEDIAAPYFLSAVSVPEYIKQTNMDAGAFITDWQDVHATDLVTFDGLKDHSGRRKISLLQLGNKWKNLPYSDSPRKIKILKPAQATVPGAELTYYAITPVNSEWKVVIPDPNDLQFEWKLVEYDYLGKPISIKAIGNGSEVKFTIPENPSGYQLYLYVLKGDVVMDIVVSDLNTPILYPRKNEI